MNYHAKVERQARDERLGFRVDSSTKALIERAAKLERRKLTEFCMSALTEAARRTIESQTSLTLSKSDRAAFFSALAAPPRPNARLKRAFQERKRRLLA